MAFYDPADDVDKMRAVVQLAASIADQLANVATSLSIEADMLSRPGALQHRDIIARLLKRNARKVDRITHELLAFVGQLPSNPSEIQVAAALTELLPMLRCLIGPHVSLRFECKASNDRIVADRWQFDQLICGLVARAIREMPVAGVISVRLTNQVIAGLDANTEWLSIEVKDNAKLLGSIDRIFEPHLTRRHGSLTIGLAALYGHVTQMQGHITIMSTSAGTALKILLPQPLAAKREELG
jgi:signal transduction histidine kinase